MKAIQGKRLFAGIHPHGRKQLSSGKPLEQLPPPEEVCISLSQSLGRPALPCVEKGAKVKRGECIAKADGAISSDVFASIAGEVIDIRTMTAQGGGEETFLVIKADQSGEEFRFPALTDPTPEEIGARVKECGIVGLGGAGFPTAVKLSAPCPVDTLILNGAECEPYLTCDHRLMLEFTDEIVRGARYLKQALDCKRIIIGIEDNKPDCISAFERYPDIAVVRLRKQYPMGGEKQLVYSATGRKIRPGKLPADAGVVVQNVATAFAVCEAVEQGKPLYERAVTVSGGAVNEPKNVWTPVGTPLSALVSFAGGEKTSPSKIVQGGPMTGIALPSYDFYTHKTTSGVLLLDEKEASLSEPSPCLSCGKCADACPMHLMPMQTDFYAEAGDYEAAAKQGGALHCIECGVCAYVCPARRPLIQSIRKTKQEMRKK